MAAYPPGPTRMVDLPAYGANSAPTDRMWIASAAVGFAVGAAADRYITPNDFLAEITRNITDVSVQFGDGAGISTVSAAGKGKIRYNNTAGSFQVSENGGAYQNLLKGSGTATRVAFWSAADELSHDAALYWDNTNKRLSVGVGTSPGAPIDVLAESVSAIAQQWRPNTGTMRAAIKLDGGPETFFGTTTAHNFHLITSDVQRLSIEAASGNVGINKPTAIAAQLQIVANAATTKGLIVNSAPSTSVNLVEFYNDAALRFVFSNAGNLTLGLAGASGATGSLTFSVNGQANTQTLQGGDTPAATNTFKWPSADPTAGQVLTASAPAAGIVTLTWGAAGSISGSGVATRVAFWSGTSSLSSDAAYYWDNTNKRLSVGVGTSPGAPIDVLAESVSAIAQQWRPNTGTMRAAIKLDGGPETFFGTTTAHNFHLITSDVQRLSIEAASGNVGINKPTAIAAQLQIVANAATTKGLIVNSAPSTSVNLVEFYNDAALRFVFSNAGNLDIGLSGAGGATGSITFNGVTSGAVTMTVAAAAGTWTLTLPTTAGSAGQFLQTNGAGVTTWATAGGGTPGGSSGELQYNNAGAFGGTTGTTYSTGATTTLSVVGQSASQLTSLFTGAASSSVAVLASRLGAGSGGDLFQAQNSGGTALLVVTANGELGAGITSSLLGRIHGVGRAGQAGGFFQAATLDTATVLIARQGSSSTGDLFQAQTSAGVALVSINNSAVLTETRNSIGTTSSDGIVLQNTTAAAAGAQQYSPRLRLTGQGWKTNATAASQTVDWIVENQPVQGAANPTSNLSFSSQINAAGYNPRLTLNSAGGSATLSVQVVDNPNTPHISFNGETNTGIGHPTGSQFSLIAAGSEQVRINTNGIGVLSTTSTGIGLGSSASSPDVGLLRNAAGVARISAGHSTSAGSLLVAPSTASVTGNFTVLPDNAATNTIVSVARLGVNSTGTAADGFGAALSWSAETSTTNDTETGRVNVFWSTATHASRTSALSFTLSNNASLAEVMRLTTPSATVGSPFVLNIHDGTNPNVWTSGSFAAKLYLISPTLPAVGVAAHFSATALDAPQWQMLRGRGTNASPTAVQATDSLGNIEWWGQTNTSTNNVVAGARIRVSATENWAAGSNGCQMIFYTSNNAGTITERASLQPTGCFRIGATSGTTSADTKLQIGNYASWNTDVVAAIYTDADDNKGLEIIGTATQTADLFRCFLDTVTPDKLTLSAAGKLTTHWLNWNGEARVSTQFDKTSDTTLANVTGLSINVVAGRTYSFKAVLYTTSNVAGGVKAAIGGTATATAIRYEAVTLDNAIVAAQTRATALGTTVGAVTAVTAAMIVITGTITVNAAGTLTVQFAQNASNATASSVLTGSAFIADDVP